MTDKLLTVEETAERLGTSVRFVRRLVFERRIAYVKLGRHVRITAPRSGRLHRRRPCRPGRAADPAAGCVTMAHIEKRTRGGRVSYRARYRAPDGTERNKTFRRKVDAEKFLATVESAKLRGAWTDPAAGRTTFAAWLEEWWGSAADLRPSTVARDEAYFNSLILPRFGGVPLAAIRQPDVQAWVAELSARFKPATVVKAYQLLGRTMTAAVNADMVPRSPCRAVRLPKVEREDMRFLNPAEVARLADVIDARYRALVLVAAYGGLRIGEWPGCAAAGSTCCAAGWTWLRSWSRFGASCTWGRPRPGPAAASSPCPGR
jgi:excisionase family DNA binding protein